MSSPTVTAVTSATSGLETDLLAVAGIGLGIGAAIFAVKRGWGLVRSFIR